MLTFTAAPVGLRRPFPASYLVAEALAVSSHKALQALLKATLLKVRNCFPLLGKKGQKVQSPTTMHF